jgi:hypothetical protein
LSHADRRAFDAGNQDLREGRNRFQKVEDRLVHVERRRLLEILEVVARGESAAAAEIVTTRTSGSSAAERSASASAEYIAGGDRVLLVRPVEPQLQYVPGPAGENIVAHDAPYSGSNPLIGESPQGWRA